MADPKLSICTLFLSCELNPVYFFLFLEHHFRDCFSLWRFISTRSCCLNYTQIKFHLLAQSGTSLKKNFLGLQKEVLLEITLSQDLFKEDNIASSDSACGVFIWLYSVLQSQVTCEKHGTESLSFQEGHISSSFWG